MTEGNKGTGMMVKIGNVVLENQVILAPMAGVTDLPFRLLCKEQGAAMVCMEMVSAKAIYYHSKNTEELMKIAPGEAPVSLQLFGSDPDLMAEIAQRIEEKPFAILDLNMGCPVPKIVNNKEGSALMQNPKLVEAIITKVSRAIKKPVTVKIRKGFEEGQENAPEIGKIAEAAGAAAIAVHGRTRQQYYSGKVDLSCIRRVKEAVGIPVIGSGDVTDGKTAKKMLDETGCDAVMVARGAEGNPWIFREIIAYLERGEVLERPTPEEVRQVMERHIKSQVLEKGEYLGIREMRKHLAWYTAGYPDSSRFRNQIQSVETMEEMLSRINVFFNKREDFF